MDDHRRLRSALAWSLRPIGRGKSTKNGEILDWFMRRLEGQVGLAIAERTVLSWEQVELARHRFVKGAPVSWLARRYNCSERQILRRIYQILDAVLASMKPEMKASLIRKEIANLVLEGCAHCGGDLEWNPSGSAGWGGIYICFACAREVTWDKVFLRNLT